MKIAIDINDVIRDNINQFLKVYKKFINPDIDIKYEDVDSFNMLDIFDFEDQDELNNFKYVDYPLELYGLAELVEEMTMTKFNEWSQKTLMDLDDEYIPEIMLVSPLEIGLSIQSTYSFLSSNICRVREIYFPVDSYTIWDRCDILITANPNLIANVPDDKIVIKIETPYNKIVDSKYTFKSLIDMIEDEDETVIKIIEKK